MKLILHTIFYTDVLTPSFRDSYSRVHIFHSSFRCALSAGRYHNTDIYVRVGDYIIHQESEPLPHQDLEVYSIRTHPREQIRKAFTDCGVARWSPSP